MEDFNKEQSCASLSFGSIAFFAMMTTYVIISLIGQTLLQAFGVTGGAAFYTVCSLFSVVAMKIVFCLLGFARKKKMTPCVYLRKFDPVYLIFALILAAGMMYGLGFVNGVVANIMTEFGINASGVNPPLDNVGQFIAFSFLLAVLPALEEEIFFRGLILDSVYCGKARGFRTVYAVFTVSLCFALYHGSLTQFFYQLIYGVFLALLTLKSGSIIPAIAAHFANNFSVLAFSFFNVNVDLKNPFLIITGIALLVLFVAFISLYKKGEKEFSGEENTVSSLKSFWLPYGLLGALICVALIIGSAVSV